MPPTAAIELPAGGRIGVSFKKGSPPIVFKVHEDSDLKGKVKPGFVVESLAFEDGSLYKDLTSKELVQLLQDSTYESGRKLKFRMELPDEMDHCMDPSRFDIGNKIKFALVWSSYMSF